MEKTSRMKDYAKKRMTLSPLMEGKEKVEIDDIVGQELTLTDFDIVHNRSKGETYSVCLFKELEGQFAFGGLVLTDLCLGFIEEFGSIEDANNTLMDEGGLKIKLTKEISKQKDENGRNNKYIKVEIL